ncbi:MAG: AgmX/PglI C-terminal domain-containing protein [Myxococcota bacterium]
MQQSGNVTASEQQQRVQDNTDRIFLLCLLLSALLHTAGGILAVSIELPPPSSEADYTAWVKRLADVPEIEEPEPEPTPEEKPQEDDKDEEKEAAEEEKPAAKSKSKPTQATAERRERVRDAVKDVGILGLIGTASEGGELANVFDSSDVVGQNIQDALDSQKELSSSNRDFRKREGGKVGDIGDVAVADGGAVGTGKIRQTAAPKAFVKSSETKALGGAIDDRKLNRILKRVQNEAQVCYKVALRNNPNLKGTILVQWSITPAGRAERFKVRRNTLGSSSVASCLEKSITKKSYRNVVKGKTPVTVQKSFSFGSTS